MKLTLHNSSMDAPSQPTLVEIPEQPPHQNLAVGRGPVKLRSVNRQQTMMAEIQVEEPAPANHIARAIGDLVGRMNLKQFTESLRTAAGCAGRPAWDPKVLISYWVFASRAGIRSEERR